MQGAVREKRTSEGSWVPGTADPVSVLVEGVDETVPLDTPHFDRLVIRCSDQSVAVVGESNAADCGGMSFENCRLSFSVAKT